MHERSTGISFVNSSNGYCKQINQGNTRRSTGQTQTTNRTSLSAGLNFLDSAQGKDLGVTLRLCHSFFLFWKQNRNWRWQHNSKTGFVFMQFLLSEWLYRYFCTKFSFSRPPTRPPEIHGQRTHLVCKCTRFHLFKKISHSQEIHSEKHKHN